MSIVAVIQNRMSQSYKTGYSYATTFSGVGKSSASLTSSSNVHL
jgi:hypothetical protein